MFKRLTIVASVVAFGLMLGGIALLGTFSATLASWLVETVAAAGAIETVSQQQSTSQQQQSATKQQRAVEQTCWWQLWCEWK